MSEDRHDRAKRFGIAVDRKARRKIDARENRDKGIWFSLGMMGLVGWSVTMPTVAGIALGRWMDTRWPGDVSWTLTFLFLGMALGCLTAWQWVKRENEDG